MKSDGLGAWTRIRCLPVPRVMFSLGWKVHSGHHRQQVSLEEYNFVYHLASVFAVSFPWQLGLARLGQSTEWVSQWSVMSSLVMWLLAWCLCSLELPRLCRDDSERVVALEQERSLWILIPLRWQTPRSKQNIMKHISPTPILHPLCFQVLWELNPTFFLFFF